MVLLAKLFMLIAALVTSPLIPGLLENSNTARGTWFLAEAWFYKLWWADWANRHLASRGS